MQKLRLARLSNVIGVENAELADWIYKQFRRHDQLILEFYTPGEPNRDGSTAAMYPLKVDVHNYACV